MNSAVPIVEITDDTDSTTARRPHAEVNTCDAGNIPQMGTQHLVDAEMYPRSEQMLIVAADHGPERIGVTHATPMPLSRDDQLIGEQIACLEPGLEEARIIHALTGREYVRTKGGDLNRLGMGQEGSHDHSIVARMHPQIGEGIVMATGEQILFIVH